MRTEDGWIRHWADSHIDTISALYVFPAESPSSYGPTKGGVVYTGRIASVNGNTVDMILYQKGFKGGKQILIEDKHVQIPLAVDVNITITDPDIYEIDPVHDLWAFSPETLPNPEGFQKDREGHTYQGCLADLTAVPNTAVTIHVGQDGVGRLVGITR